MYILHTVLFMFPEVLAMILFILRTLMFDSGVIV